MLLYTAHSLTMRLMHVLQVGISVQQLALDLLPSHVQFHRYTLSLAFISLFISAYELCIYRHTLKAYKKIHS